MIGRSGAIYKTSSTWLLGLCLACPHSRNTWIAHQQTSPPKRIEKMAALEWMGDELTSVLKEDKAVDDIVMDAFDNVDLQNTMPDIGKFEDTLSSFWSLLLTL